MISIILLISNICSQLSNPTNKTIKWMLDLYLKNKEVINYLIVGGLTTVVSIVSYALFRFIINNYILICPRQGTPQFRITNSKFRIKITL